MECSFQVGDRVVCVEMERLYPEGVVPVDEPVQPVVGKIYTVREILIGKVSNAPCIKVEEIPDQHVQVIVNGELLIGDVVFEAIGFRRIVQRKTSIEVFKAMLTPSNQKVTA